MYPEIDLEKVKGTQLGKGADKIVYRHSGIPSHCLKICSKNRANATKREIEYFKFLKNRNVHASFIPEFYGAFEGDDYIGFEQESIIDKESGGSYDSVVSLCDFILDPSSNVSKIQKMLDALKAEMIKTNVIVCDLHGLNILHVTKDSSERLMVIDGYGVPEFIPLAKYTHFFGKLKIERQWKKLMMRLERYFNEKQGIVS